MTGMSVKKQTGRNRKLIPEFVNNEAQFRSVLVHATVKYVFRQAAIPKDIATDLENLKRLADDRTGKMRSQIEVSNKYWNSMSKHLRAVHDVGGYMQMISTVMYRSWKLGWHSNEIGVELGMTDDAVSRQLIRLAHIARDLGYPTYARRRNDGTAPEEGPDADAIAEAYRNSATIDALRKQFHRDDPIIRRILKDRGVYVWHRMRNRRVDEEKKAEAVITLYNAGEKIMVIASQVHVDRSFVVKVLKDRGVYNFSRLRKKAKRHEKATSQGAVGLHEQTSKGHDGGEALDLAGIAWG